MAEDATVTSDKPWTATTEGKAVTMPSGSWNYGGDIPQYGLGIDSEYNPVTVPTCWKAGEGWVFYEPPAGEGSPARLTLDNAACADGIAIDVGASVSVVAKGENRVGAVVVLGPVTVDENGGTLNTFVAEGGRR